MKANFKTLILCLTPLMVVIDLVIFSFITESLRAKSDISVMVGVITLCLLVFGNIILFKFLFKKIFGK